MKTSTIKVFITTLISLGIGNLGHQAVAQDQLIKDLIKAPGLIEGDFRGQFDSKNEHQEIGVGQDVVMMLRSLPDYREGSFLALIMEFASKNKPKSTLYLVDAANEADKNKFTMTPITSNKKVVGALDLSPTLMLSKTPEGLRVATIAANGPTAGFNVAMTFDRRGAWKWLNKLDGVSMNGSYVSKAGKVEITGFDPQLSTANVAVQSETIGIPAMTSFTLREVFPGVFVLRAQEVDSLGSKESATPTALLFRMFGNWNASTYEDNRVLVLGLSAANNLATGALFYLND